MERSSTPRPTRLSSATLSSCSTYPPTRQCRPHSSDCWLDERHRLCVSDRMYAVLSQHRIDGCAVTIAADGRP